MNNTDTAETILRDLHFQVFTDMERVGDRKKRAFQRALKGLRTLEHAVHHLTGKTFTGFPLNCGISGN